MDYRLTVSNVDDANRETKYIAAVGALAKSMKVSPVIRRKAQKHKEEEFPFHAYRDMVQGWNDWYDGILNVVYDTTCRVFDIPNEGRLQKAKKPEMIRPPKTNQDFMAWKGRILYSPETGKPITKGQWEAFVKALERFLNRNLKEAEKRLVLSAAALGRILDRMLKFNTWEAVQRLRLDEIRAKTGNAQFHDEGAFRRYYKVPVSESNRMEIAQSSAAIYIQGIGEKTRDTVRKVLMEGIKERSTKHEIGQTLRDSLGALNRDWQRIVETETNENLNRSFLQSQVAQSKPGEKVYFQRFEAGDDAVCDHCKAIKGRVVLWVESPRETEKIDAPYASVAIWDGKSRFRRKASDPWIAAGVQHPWCRGLWIRWHSPVASKNASFDAAMAMMRKKQAAWGEAVKKAYAEFASRGIRNPNDETPGYLDRINQIFKGEA